MKSRDQSKLRQLEEFLYSEPASELLPYFNIADHSARLAGTNKNMYAFFKPMLEECAAKKLLSYVLQANAVKAKQMYTANPRLLFITTSAEEWASGFECEKDDVVNRTVELSPLGAMAATGDRWMLKEALHVLATYYDKNTAQTGLMLAAEQIKQQFPNGFNYPASSYDYDPLITALSNDRELMQTGKPGALTSTLLKQFRKDFIPGVIKSGFVFNLNELVKVLKIHDLKWDAWNVKQLCFFWDFIITYLERLVSAVFAQAISQGIANVVSGNPLIRSLLLPNHDRIDDKPISFFPLDKHPRCRLGLGYGRDAVYHSERLEYIKIGGRYDAIDALRVQEFCKATVVALEEYMLAIQPPQISPQSKHKRHNCVMQ